MPIIGWLATGGDASAYRYLLHGVNEFPTAEALAEELRQVGFVNVSFERLSLGIVAIHIGEKRCRLPPNKQLQRTVIRRRGRGACASFHCAHAPRWTRAARGR